MNFLGILILNKGNKIRGGEGHVSRTVQYMCRERESVVG